MIERPSVEALMAGPLGGWLEQHALYREDAKKKAGNRLFLAGMIGLPALAFLWILVPQGGTINFMITVFVCMGAWVWSQAPKRSAAKEVKVGINKAIAEALGLDYSHEVEPGLVFSYCRKYQLVPDHDRSSFEDEWSGLVDGRRFRLFEAHLEEQQGSGKNRRWVTVFRGAILQIGCRRDLHGTTLVQRSGQHRKLFGLGGKKDSVSFGGHQLDCVDLVHPQFADAFDVWSDDQVGARYLVHPTYVEKLIALEQAFHGQGIQALFTEGDLTISLKSENLFESGSIDADNDRARLAQTIEQFGRLADLADALNEQKRGVTQAPPAAMPQAPAAEQPAPIPPEGIERPATRPVFGRKGL
jgi:hypothetical protein